MLAIYSRVRGTTSHLHLGRRQKQKKSVNNVPDPNVHCNPTVFPRAPLQLLQLAYNLAEYSILKQHIADISMKAHTCETLLLGANAELQLPTTERPALKPRRSTE